jgi:hypothetical protein
MGPSRALVAAILIPVLALVGALTVWAYRVRDWTWFGLLLAAAVGLIAFVIAPDLFSITGQQRPDEWCLTMPHGAPQTKSAERPKAPHRTA